MKEKAFNNWRHNAIHLTFPNGNSLSTVWGYLTYSDNHDWNDAGADYFKTWLPSDTCEIMILNAPEKLVRKIQEKYDFEYESVKGYLTMSEWLDIVKMLSEEIK